MKTLRKFRLINWHYFSNTTTDIKNITFLTGPNGAGKSTIIDALQILILGSTRQDNFNKAANEKGKSGRTLLSYLRGQTGIDDNGNVINIRIGSFSSYLAMEIYDDVNKNSYTLGIVFDVDSADNIDKHFFYLDSPFPANDFTNTESEPDKKKVRPLSYREFSSYVRANYSQNHFRFFDSDSDYHNFFKEINGNLPDKYFSLFKKAVSFAPISNISTFITEYICDTDIHVDIEPMKKNIQQYNILEMEAKNLKEKMGKLELIQSAFDDYNRYQRSLDMLTYVNARVNYDEYQKKASNLSNKITSDNNRLAEISNRILELDKRSDELRSDLNSYEAKRLQSSNYSLTEKLSMKKNSLTSSITAITMQINSTNRKIRDYADEYARTLEEFLSYYKKFDSSRLGDTLGKSFNELYELAGDTSAKASNIAKEIEENRLDHDDLSSFRDDMETLKNQAISFKSQLNNAFYKTSDKLQSLQMDLSAVNSGNKPFDSLGPSYTAIRKELTSALKARHSDAYVHIYCDLVDVIDPEWTMALEAVLFNQKFNFFVNPEYYEEANRLMKELADNYHYYHVSLVDTERLLNSHIEARPGSVAELIRTSDEGARAYTDYVLGRIKKCTTFEEARRSGSGLLSDCTGYRGFATWYLNKNNARIFYLGTQVNNDTKALSASDYQSVNQLYSLLSEMLNRLSPLLSLSVMSKDEMQTYLTDLERHNEIENLENQVGSLDVEMKKAATGTISDVAEKIDELNKELSSISQEKDSLLTERGSLNSEITRIKSSDLPNINSQALTYKEALTKFDADIVNREYEPFYNKLVEEQHLSPSQIRITSQKEYITNENKARVSKSNLTKTRNDYCTLYHLNYDVYNFRDNAEFKGEYERISQVLLPQYEEKIASAHSASIREFKDDFIYKLRSAIESINAQIADLNEALGDSKFGNDSYHFKVSPNRDYREYYDMIMDPLLLRSGDAESLFMEKYKVTMDNLFNLISSSTSASGEEREQVMKNIELFTQATTYINFDLLVNRGEEETNISLSRSFKSQSGGETQTPFYISILASFASLTRAKNPKDNNTFRLVIFDEAFSKMDATRIQKSTTLLRQFDLQAILSTPSEKLRDLVDYVDLILIAMHDEKHKRSGLDVYQDKRDKTKKLLEESNLPNVTPTVA